MKHSRHRLVQSLAAVCALFLGVVGNASAQTRDPVNPLDLNNPQNSPIWPFASTSPWNMPIGSGAQYVPINLAVPFGHGTPPDTSNWAPVPGISDEYIVLTPSAPLTDVNYSNAGWTGADRCPYTGSTPTRLATVPIPTDYSVPSVAPDFRNNSAAFLMPDRRTIIQSQPFVLCRPSQTQATSSVVFNYVDVYGDGRWGSHGGSQLSAIGGSIHLGELRPGKPVRHAIAIMVDTPVVLSSCLNPADPNDNSACFRWPAYSADSGAAMSYGTNNTNPVPGMKMGALLAIPATTNINNLGLESDPGRMLAWTLQNYGAYIVDSTGGPGFYIDADIGPNAAYSGSKREEFFNDFCFIDSTTNPPNQCVHMPFQENVNDGDGTHSFFPWTRDVQKLMQALYLVDNNGPDSIGGGGTPLQPLAPPLAITRFENDISAIVGNPDSAWVLHGPEAAAFSDGTAHSANTPTTATFTFTGTALSWIGLKCSTCGTATVSIDGGTPTQVDTFDNNAPLGPGLTSGVVYTTPTLAAGSHTIVITILGTADVFIDALDVTP